MKNAEKKHSENPYRIPFGTYFSKRKNQQPDNEAHHISPLPFQCLRMGAEIYPKIRR